MITGEIKNKVDKMWEYFWTGGLTNPVDVIEQLTYLIFIKQCKNTRDNREMNCTKILVSIQGNLYVDTEQNRATKKLNCWELLKLV